MIMKGMSGPVVRLAGVSESGATAVVNKESKPGDAISAALHPTHHRAAEGQRRRSAVCTEAGKCERGPAVKR